MPKKVERALKREAKKKGFTGARADRYVYGAMNNLNMLKRSQRKAPQAKGR